MATSRRRVTNAASGERPDWSLRDATAVVDPSTEFAESAQRLAAADTVPGALDADWPMPWGDVPGSHALAIHAVDVLVHGWDLASATGRHVTLDAGLSEFALLIVAAYPASAWGEGGFFASAVPVDPSSPAGISLVAALRRAPA